MQEKTSNKKNVYAGNKFQYKKKHLCRKTSSNIKEKHLCRCRPRCARRRLYHSAPSRRSKFQRRSTSLSLTSVYHHHQYLYQFPINIINIIIINILIITEISIIVSILILIRFARTCRRMFARRRLSRSAHRRDAIIT